MNNKITIAVGAAVLIGLAFFGGYKYATAKSVSAATTVGGQYAGRSGGMRGTGRFASGGAAFGQIVSKDDKSITVTTQGGGSRIIFLSASTTVSKMTQGTFADLAVGQSVSVTGTANSDGSMTATAVDLRPVPSMSK